MHGRFSNLFRQKVLAPTYQHTKDLLPSGGANLASLYSDPPRPVKAQNRGAGVYRREVCHKQWVLAPFARVTRT
jgi:hypothetical protein